MVGRYQLERSDRTQPCDLCGAVAFDVLDRHDRHRQPLTTVCCRQCGLVSHEAVPTEDELQQYYRSRYRQDYHGEFTPAAHRVIRAWRGGQWLFRRLRPYVPAGSQVCEIGAGIGCTVKQFELAGYDAEGIEPGIGFQQFARDRLHARVSPQGLYDLPGRPRWDFVLLVHVIEHFSSPRRALLHIHQLLRDDGRLYVECPNIGAPHAAPGKQFHFAHIHNFTPATLEMLARRCGYRIVARLAGPRARAIRFVLQRTTCSETVAVPGSYEQSVRAVRDCTPAGYYLRPHYWLDRLHRDARFLSHHVLPMTRLRRIAARCQQPLPGAAPGLLTTSG